MNGEMHELALRYGLPVIGDLNEFTAQPEALACVPHALASRLKVLPLSRVGNILTIVINEPVLALPAIDEVRFHTGGLNIECVIASAEAIEAAIQRFYTDQTVEMRVDALVADALQLPDIRRATARRTSSLTQKSFYVGSLEGQPKYEDVIADCMKPKKETNG
jgi:hypothetical protein